MPDGGIVKIKTENITINHKSTLPLPEDRYIKIVVRDQGVGISEKHLAKIFDPYFTTKHTGHGLGLATTYSIIKRHGGHITVDSEIDNGTTFTIYLPATSQKLEELTPLKVANHSGKGKILVMDDEDPILKVSKRILTSLGYEVVLAKDGLEAIESYKNYFAQNDPFDLTILDLTVPGGLGGAETIPGILKINPEAKIVVSSGYSNDPVMAKYKDYGLCGVLAKPYRQGQLAELLNEIFSETASS